MQGSEGRKSLERQLDAALEDLDAPPSSLPIASSDIDIDEHHTQEQEQVENSKANTSTNTNDEADTETEGVPVKQHWPGLPPSSPPAPSSPMLLPESTDEDEEMEDIPIATSDSETDAEMTPVDSPAYFNEELANSLSAADLSVLFPDFAPPNGHHTDADGSSTHSDIDAAHMFQQFANVSSDADVFAAMAAGSQASEQTQIDNDLDAIFGNGLEGIDFTEFWETFKPMINNSTQEAGGDATSELDNSSPAYESEPGSGVNHIKLADDIQGLLSGCLM